MKDKRLLFIVAAIIIGNASLLYIGLRAARFIEKTDPDVRPSQQYYSTTESAPDVKDLAGFTFWSIANLSDKNITVVSNAGSVTIKPGELKELSRKNNFNFVLKNQSGEIKRFGDVHQHYIEITNADPIKIKVDAMLPE